VTEASDNTEAVKSNRRMEDQFKLRELELATQYELKFLSDSFKDLRTYVQTKLDTESDKFEALNKRVTLLTYFILVQLAGLDAEKLIAIVKGIPF